MSKLTQEELFIALAKGRKVRKTTWKPEHYIYLFNSKVISQDSWIILQLDLQANWELYIETVSFFEALEAMKEGKKVKCMDTNVTIFFNQDDDIQTTIGNLLRIRKDHLDCKWQILEGDSDEIRT